MFVGKRVTECLHDKIPGVPVIPSDARKKKRIVHFIALFPGYGLPGLTAKPLGVEKEAVHIKNRRMNHAAIIYGRVALCYGNAFAVYLPKAGDLRDVRLIDKKLPVQVIGASVDTDANAVKSFAAEHQFNYPVVLAGKKALKPFGNMPGIPMKFIINDKGVIVDKLIGAQDKEALI